MLSVKDHVVVHARVHVRLRMHVCVVVCTEGSKENGRTALCDSVVSVWTAFSTCLSQRAGLFHRRCNHPCDK